MVWSDCRTDCFCITTDIRKKLVWFETSYIMIITDILDKHRKSNIYIYMYIYIYISSSSSCRAAGADIPDRLSPFLPIIHRLRQVFWVTSRVLTQLLYVGSCRSSHSCTSMCGGPQEYIAYELVLASPAVSCVSCSSNLYSFCDGGQVSV